MTVNKKSSVENSPDITIKEISEHIQFLASDELKGRYPGTPESKIAQKYLVEQYKSNGIEPLDKNGYLQHFDFINAIILGPNNSFYCQ